MLAGATLPELVARLGHATLAAAMVYLHGRTDRDGHLAQALATAMTGRDAGGSGSPSSLHGGSPDGEGCRASNGGQKAWQGLSLHAAAAAESARRRVLRCRRFGPGGWALPCPRRDHLVRFVPAEQNALAFG